MTSGGRGLPARRVPSTLWAGILAGLLSAVWLATAVGSAAARPVQEEAREAADRRAVGDDSTRPRGAAAPLSDAELDRLTAEVADQLRCPVCRNQSVLESSSELARGMQAVMRERLAAGESPEEVRAYFVARYGEWILLQPPARGINWIVYLLPAALVLGGGLLLRSRIRTWRATRADRLEPGAGRAPHEDPAPREDPTTREHVTPSGERGVEATLTERDEAWLDEAIRSR